MQSKIIMQCKIIKAPRHEKEYTTTNIYVFFAYLKQFTDKDPDKKFDHIWQDIKQNKKDIVYTIDTLLLLINEGCFKLNKEKINLLQYLQKNEIALKGFLDIFNETIEQNWTSLDFSKIVLDQDVKPEQLYATVTETRKKAISHLNKWLYENNDFITIAMEHCPLLLEGLNDACLKKLLLKNYPSISLLTNKKMANRVSQVLVKEDIVQLFLTPIRSTQLPIYTIVLLRYCSEYQAGILNVIFKLINSSAPAAETQLQNPAEIRKRIMQCGDKLLVLFEKFPEIFLPFVQKTEILFEVLSFTKTPGAFLSKIVSKDNQIANWVTENLLVISNYLLNHPVEEVKKLLNTSYHPLTGGKKTTFSHLLEREIRDLLRDESQFGALELNAFFMILAEPELRALLNLEQDEVLNLMHNKNFRPLVDYLIATDEKLWKEFKNSGNKDLQIYLTPENIFIYNKNIENNFHLNGGVELSLKLEPCNAFLLANGAHWEKIKNKISQSGDKSNFHPFLLLKIQYEKNKGDKSFKHYLIDYLMSEDGIPFLMGHNFDLDFFCVMATGKDYLNLIEKLRLSASNFRSRNCGSLMDGVLLQIKKLVDLILNNEYFSIKFAAALDSHNIPIIRDFLNEDKLTPLIDCEEWIAACLEMESNLQLQIIIATAKNTSLVKKLFKYSAENQHYTYQMLKLLKNQLIGDELLSCLSEQEVIELINTTSVDIIKFIFESESYLAIADAMLPLIKEFLPFIKKPEMLTYFFGQEKILKFLTSGMSEKQFVAIIISDIMMQSKSLIQNILKHRHTFPFSSLIENKMELINLLSKNKFFAEMCFMDSVIFRELKLTPENLLQICVDEKFIDSAQYLANKPSLLFFSLLKSIMTALPKKLQFHLLQYFPFLRLSDQSKSPERKCMTRRIGLPANFTYMEAAELDRKRNNYRLLEKEGSGLTYRGLTGHKALKLQLVHYDLILNLDMGIDSLLETISKNEINFTLTHLPITLLLTEKFYLGLLKMVNSEGRNYVYHFLSSLPYNFIDLSELFDVQNEVHQIVFLRIYIRVKQLLYQTLMSYFHVLKEAFSETIVSKFLHCLNLAMINIPTKVFQQLHNEDFFQVVIKAIYDSSFHLSNFDNQREILLKIFLLKTSFSHSKMGAEAKETFVAELYLLTSQLWKESKEMLVNLFPVDFLLEIQHQQLTGYFLRQPFYVEKLNAKDICLLIKDSSELSQCVFIYPHLYNKLSTDHLIYFSSLLHQGSPKEVANKLSGSLLTVSITNDHPAFKEDKTADQTNITTTKLFEALKITQKMEESESPVYLDNANPIAKLLYANNYFSIINLEAISKNLLDNINSPLINEMYIIESFLTLVLEPINTKGLSHFINELALVSRKKVSLNGVNEKTVQKWQAEYLARNNEEKLKEILVEELQGITGIKISQVEAQPVNLNHVGLIN